MEKTEDNTEECQLSAEELKEQGNTYLREGKVAEAIESYTKSIGKLVFQSIFSRQGRN